MTYHPVLIQLLALLFLATLEPKSVDLIRDTEGWTKSSPKALQMRGRTLTVKIKVIHASDIRLGLPTDEANTLVLAAVTRLCIMTIPPSV